MSKTPRHSTTPPDGSDTPSSPDFISSKDAISLLQLIGGLSAVKFDPRAWRLELLTGVNRIVSAFASLAFVVRDVESQPQIVSLFDAGFRSDEHRLAVLREFNTAPFGDPFSQGIFQQFTSRRLDSLTLLRVDVIEDAAWTSNPHVQAYRRVSGTGDCMISLRKGIERGSAFAIYVFRPAVSAPAPGSPQPGADVLAAARFTVRDRVILETLHSGLDGIYRVEASAHKVNRGSGLPPRLRQTLEYLLAGDTERQVALKMSLSVHTVHDYVKSLYTHFGVSSRGELLAKWIGSGEGKHPPS